MTRCEINLLDDTIIRSSLDSFLETKPHAIVHRVCVLQSVKSNVILHHNDIDYLQVIKDYGTHLDENPDKVPQVLRTGLGLNRSNVQALPPMSQPPHTHPNKPSCGIMDAKAGKAVNNMAGCYVATKAVNDMANHYAAATLANVASSEQNLNPCNLFAPSEDGLIFNVDNVSPVKENEGPLKFNLEEKKEGPLKSNPNKEGETKGENVCAVDWQQGKIGNDSNNEKTCHPRSGHR